MSDIGPTVALARLDDVQLLAAHGRIVRGVNPTCARLKDEIKRFAKAVREDARVSARVSSERVARGSRTVACVDPQHFADRVVELPQHVRLIGEDIVITQADVKKPVRAEVNVSVCVEVCVYRRRFRKLVADHGRVYAAAVFIGKSD